jgi:hypothetical protein
VRRKGGGIKKMKGWLRTAEAKQHAAHGELGTPP